MGFGVQRYVYNHQVLSANIAIYRYLVAWGPGGGDGFPLWISGFLRLFFFFLADKLYNSASCRADGDDIVKGWNCHSTTWGKSPKNVVEDSLLGCPRKLVNG